jgi:hypothetical protein
VEKQGDPDDTTIQWSVDGKTVEVHNLDPSLMETLAKDQPSRERWPTIFAVHVESKSSGSNPAVLGDYRVTDRALIFEPRFPFRPGVRYSAEFDPAALGGASAKELPKIKSDYMLPHPLPPTRAVLEHVYPTTNRLPENQLKFYLHFSVPMSRGEAYRHIHLLDAAGQEVDLPFLELDEELWDPAGKRFTLLFDPGRIKRGLKPREVVGPALEEGKSYTLLIDAGWNDAVGNPLQGAFRKSFQVGPPDDRPPDPKSWKLQPPPRGTSQPVVVRFPKPMDHAMLHRVLWVVDAAGKTVPGSVTVVDEEREWQLTPKESWPTGAYQLVIDTTLEDLAGNSIGRAFEVDVLQPIQRKVEAKTVSVPFRIE